MRLIPWFLNRRHFEQLIHLAVAVREFVERHTDFIEQRQVEVRERRGLRIFEMAIAFQSRGRAAGDNNGKIRVIVNVRIPDAAAVEEQRMIQQSAIAFARRFQLPKELREQRNVERIDFRHARDLLQIVAMVR